MTDPIIDRVIAILHHTPRVAVPLTDLAARVPTGDIDGLARRIAREPRLLLVETPGLPHLSVHGPDRDAAYRTALRDAGLQPVRHVALRRRGPESDASSSRIAALLLETAARLLAPGPAADALVHATDRAHRAVLATAAEGPPSTTPPPGPRPPPRTPRTRPHPADPPLPAP